MDVWHPAYPTTEYGGLIFVYMGPPGTEPLFPMYDIIDTRHRGDVELRHAPLGRLFRRLCQRLQLAAALREFDGRCEEAAEFYRRTLGAEVAMLMRFKDGPEPQQPGMVPPGAEDKVMHMCLRVGDTTFMASDGRCLGQPNFQGFSLSLTVPNEAEAERQFASLGDGGQVQMPLAKTFFSPRFGMVADRFGVSWMVYVAP
jgi:PhnB protein